MKIFIMTAVLTATLLCKDVIYSKEKKIGGLNVFEDKNGQISLVQNDTWKPDELTKELEKLYRARGFTELELTLVNPTPELIETISSFSKLTHLTIGEPPEGVFIKNKAILHKLAKLKNLTEINLCIVGLSYEDLSFLKDMPKLWKVIIIKSG